jgi:hypothetical protein
VFILNSVDGQILRLRLDFGSFLFDVVGLGFVEKKIVVFLPVESWLFEGFWLVDCSTLVVVDLPCFGFKEGLGFFENHSSMKIH